MSKKIILDERNGCVWNGEMSTKAGPSFPEESDTNNSVSELVLFNNLSYNLHSFA